MAKFGLYGLQRTIALERVGFPAPHRATDLAYTAPESGLDGERDRATQGGTLTGVPGDHWLGILLEEGYAAHLERLHLSLGSNV